MLCFVTATPTVSTLYIWLWPFVLSLRTKGLFLSTSKPFVWVFCLFVCVCLQLLFLSFIFVFFRFHSVRTKNKQPTHTQQFWKSNAYIKSRNKSGTDRQWESERNWWMDGLGERLRWEGRDSAKERVTQHVVSLPRTVIKQNFYENETKQQWNH